MLALIRAGMLPRLRSNICAATSRGSDFREKENRATTPEASWDPSQGSLIRKGGIVSMVPLCLYVHERGQAMAVERLFDLFFWGFHLVSRDIDVRPTLTATRKFPSVSICGYGCGR